MRHSLNFIFSINIVLHSRDSIYKEFLSAYRIVEYWWLKHLEILLLSHHLILFHHKSNEEKVLSLRD